MNSLQNLSNSQRQAALLCARLVSAVVALACGFGSFFDVQRFACDDVTKGLNIGIMVCTVGMLLFPLALLMVWCTQNSKSGNSNIGCIAQALQFAPLVLLCIMIAENVELSQTCAGALSPVLVTCTIVIIVPIAILTALFFRVDFVTVERDADGNERKPGA